MGVFEEQLNSLSAEENGSSVTDGIQPPPKKPKLSLSLKKKQQPLKEVTNTGQFASLVTEEAYNEAGKGVVPANTKQCNSWTLRTFHAWSAERNKRVSSDYVPSDILTCNDAGVVCKYVRYFVLEVQREDGKPYPPGTIQNLLSGLFRVTKENGAPFSILDKGNPIFHELLLTLESVTSSLHQQGIGATKHSAAVISFEHGTLVWEK